MMSKRGNKTAGNRKDQIEQRKERQKKIKRLKFRLSVMSLVVGLSGFGLWIWAKQFGAPIWDLGNAIAEGHLSWRQIGSVWWQLTVLGALWICLFAASRTAKKSIDALNEELKQLKKKDRKS